MPRVHPRWLSQKQLDLVKRWPWREAERRKNLIRARGLPVQISVDWLGSLLILKVKPLRGFLHLVKNRYVKEICRRYGPYRDLLLGGELAADPAVQLLHRSSKYRDRGLRISA